MLVERLSLSFGTVFLLRRGSRARTLGDIMIDISVQHLKIAFEQGNDILRDVTFDVTRGEHIGILGRNGAGKTTLFRIIAGEISPDVGSVTTAPGTRIGVLSQIPHYPRGFTGEDVLIDAQRFVLDMGDRMRYLEKLMERGNADNDVLREYDTLSAEFLRLGGYELGRFRDKVANGLGIPDAQREQDFTQLSGGEQTRINLARLLLDNTEILLLDEPTNHLDLSAAEWLEEHITGFKGTVLTISHDRYFLDAAVTRIIELENGIAEFYSGNYSFYLDEKRRRFDALVKQYDKEQAKLAQLNRAAEKLHLWAFMGADKLHKRAFSIEKRMEKLTTTDKPQHGPTIHGKFEEAEFRGDEVLFMRGVSKAFGEKRLFGATDLLIRRGERIALIGDNGTGKSTFVKMIMGEETVDSGLLRLGPTVKTAYLPQRVTFEDEDLTVLDCMMEESGCSRQTAFDRLAAYLFRGDELETRVSQLSGGEKSRLKLCILMGEDVNFLILDEPTNHLDAMSREWMENTLEDYGEALLFVSHDRYFINRFATRIWEISNGEIHDYKCNYETYKARQEHNSELQRLEKSKAARPAEKTKPKPVYNRERELKKVEREIAALEKRLGENAALQEEYSADYEKLMDLTSECSGMENELSQLYKKWEELAE